jgi:hypothetical protein
VLLQIVSKKLVEPSQTVCEEEDDEFNQELRVF